MRKALLLATALMPSMPATAGDGPTFRPDTELALRTAHTLGRAHWRDVDGQIVADLGSSESAQTSVLLFDSAYQNVGVYTQAACESCEVGLLIRAKRTADEGLEGILVSASATNSGMALVRIAANGRVVSRVPLPAKAGVSGLPSAFGVIVSDAMHKAPPYKPLPLPAGVSLPDLAAASGTWRTGWNTINLMVYGTALTATLNGGANPGLPASTLPDAPDYGQVGLLVSGQGQVRLRHTLVHDLMVRATPDVSTGAGWQKRQLDPWAMAWSATVGDFNRDGVPDVTAGEYWWEGPKFSRAHEIATPVFYNPSSDYPQRAFISFAYDFDGDGWPDVLTVSGNSGYGDVTLYTNPRGASRHWPSRKVLSLIANEETLFTDIDGDGKPELIHAFNHALAYSKWSADASRWTTVQISEPGPWGEFVGHGLGIGDINGDGRMDYLSAYGWWEHPERDADTVKWRWHPQAFGRRGETQGGAGGAGIGVWDVNGDGLADVVTTLEGHGFGLAWYEQQRDGADTISFVRHIIMDGFLDDNAGGVTFTEPHGAAFADINGDGIPDMVTGKRLMSHLFSLKDPDPQGSAVLYVYRTVRDPAAPGGARFEPMLVDTGSGVGSHPLIADVDRDGKPDILTSGALGTYVFYNRLAAPKR